MLHKTISPTDEEGYLLTKEYFTDSDINRLINKPPASFIKREK